MKNFILLSTVLTSSFLLSACTPSSNETSSMMEDPMMEDSMENVDHSAMGHDMKSMMVQSDEDFIALMIPHHQEAIDTAKVILEKSENTELKTLAQNIVDAQTLEIEQMESWGKEWFGSDFKASEQYEEMMPDLSVLEGEALDQAFIEGMIGHHEMAITMAYEIQMITEQIELLEMADAIIDTQSAEIKTMEGWLN